MTPCICPPNEIGDIRCHNCGERVNVRCWQCGTPRGEGGPCPPVTRDGNHQIFVRPGAVLGHVELLPLDPYACPKQIVNIVNGRTA